MGGKHQFAFRPGRPLRRREGERKSEVEVAFSITFLSLRLGVSAAICCWDAVSICEAYFVICFSMKSHATYVVIALSLFPLTTALSQENPSRFSFFPDHVQFVPFLSNHEEPRVGIQQEIGSSRMKVGIGNMLDAIQYAWDGDTLRWGVDFFVYALANDHKGFRLKIDAADGFFGMHFTLANGSALKWRFRALHLSAHFVDGHFDEDLGVWDSGRPPIPFSRNYGELSAAYSFPAVRLYAGASYAVVNKPAAIRRFAALCGSEVRLFDPPYLHIAYHWYIAYHFALMGVPVYVGSNALECGIKIGEWTGKGLRVYLSYYSGLDNFGEYYDIRQEIWGVGFTFDFW